MFISVADAAVGPGELIKASQPAVYYLADDGKRYVFPNERIYFSWYEDFSTVKEVSDEQMASYQIGGNITYRPGTRLLKLQSVPTVYAIEPGGILRAIGSESVAIDLYGPSWASRVDDLPDSFFGSYTRGVGLETALYPEGTLLIDESSEDLYLIWGGEKRSIDDSVKALFRYQDIFAVTMDTSSIQSGGSVSTSESQFRDTAESSFKNQEELIVVNKNSNSTTVAQDAKDAVLLSFTLSLAEDTRISSLPVTFMASDDDDGDEEDLDVDAEGLIFGEDQIQKDGNFKNIRIKTAAGDTLFSTMELQLTPQLDREQTRVFTGTEILSKGRHVVQVVVDTYEDAPIDSRYTVSVDLDEAILEVNNLVVPDPLGTITSSQFKIVSSSVLVSRSGLIKSEFTFAGLGGPYDVLGMDFKNNQSSSLYLEDLTITGFVDAGEGEDDFSQGFDDDNSVSTDISEIISSVSVRNNATGEIIASTSSILSGGRMSFTDLHLELPAKETVVLIFEVITKDAAPYHEAPDRLALDIIDVIEDIEIRNEEGSIVDADAETLNGADNPTTYLTISDGGSLEIDGSGISSSTRLIAGSVENQVYQLRFEPNEEEDIVIDKVAIRVANTTDLTSVERVYIKYTNDSGAIETTGGFANGVATFSDLDLSVTKDTSETVRFYIDMRSVATSGGELAFDFYPNTFSAHGSTSGYIFSDDDFNVLITDSTSASDTATIRKNKPSFTNTSSNIDSGQSRASDTEMLRFIMDSSGEGNSLIRKLTFKIEPSDIGADDETHIEADNDLLEYLADVLGDARDDDDIIDLIDRETNTTLGEGTNAHIKYSIYDFSEKAIDFTPAGINTDEGDYGLITYSFVTGITLFPGAAREYGVTLDTTGAVKNANVTVTLLGGNDFLWSDGTTSGANQNGDSIHGLPVSGNQSVQ